MLFPTIRRLEPPRPRRGRMRVLGVIETLEVRSLLSSMAVIQWEMTPRVALDPAHGNQPDLPNTPAYANPSNGFEVQLDASGSTGVGPSTTFAWTVTNAKGRVVTRLTGENPTVTLPEGSFRVKLRANGLIGTDQPSVATTTVKVNDVLVVSIGDSYASGEGNPVVPGFLSPEWAFSPDPAMDLENANAHRSTVAGPAQFALQLEQSNPHQSVTFVSVANSGASITQGVLGPMPSIGDPSVQLPAEIAELRQIIGNRAIDVLTISVGANDVGFVAQVENLIENTYFGSPTRAAIKAQVDANLKALPGRYVKLARAIRGLDPGQVLITEYPDLTRNQQGNVAPILGPLDVPLIGQSNVQFALNNIILPLDSAVSTAAAANDWTFVSGISSAFSTHGYPSTDSWIRQLEDSLQMQGSVDGTFHPNAAGHQAIAGRLLATYQGLGRKSRATA